MIGSTWTDIHWTLEAAVHTDATTGEIAQMDTSNLKYRVSAASREDVSGPLSLIIDGVGRRYRFSHLQPATWYTFSVSVVTEDAESQATDINVVTNPSDMPIPLVSRYDTHEMAIKFAKDTFHYLNGPVKNYAILVASSQAVRSLPIQSSINITTGAFLRTATLSSTHLPSSSQRCTWRQRVASVPGDALHIQSIRAQRRQDGASVLHRHRAMHRASVAAEFPSDGALFSACFPNASPHQQDYCNGGLAANIKYALKLRGCTKELICMETDFIWPGRRSDWVPNKHVNVFRTNYGC